MANKLLWYVYGPKYVLRNKFLKKIKKEKVWPHYSCDFYDHDGASDVITKKILEGKPFMAARVGWNELSIMKAFDFEKKDKYHNVLKNMCDVAGFFPNEEKYGQVFLECMKDTMPETDVLGLMDSPLEDYYVNHLMRKDATVTPVSVFDFWKLKNPWTKALAGKKVLVVHPFVETIESQYKNHREELFENKELIPEFELQTYKAVQTAGGEADDRFETWFDALEFMRNEISQLDFDIAILGCGAYGFPLAAYIKRMGKQVIHMGGVSQTLFGIKGQRWTKPTNSLSKLMTDAWVWPSENETPKNVDIMEGGPYFRPTESYQKFINNNK